MDIQATHRDLNNWEDFNLFLKRYFSQFALVSLGLFYITTRVNSVGGVSLSLDALGSIPLYLLYINILGLFFMLVTIFQDVEIRILETDDQHQVHGLLDLSYSFKALFVSYIGLSFLSDLWKNYGQGVVTEQIIQDAFIAAFLGVGVPLFMSFIYYISPFHEAIVNNLRKELIKKKDEMDIIIGEVVFDEIQCNNCMTINTLPNDFCKNCGLDIKQMKSAIFEQPVRVGTLIYRDLSDQVDLKQVEQMVPDQSSLWTSSRKWRFFLSAIIPGLFFLLLIWTSLSALIA